MKILACAAAAILTGCFHPLEATSESVLKPAESVMTVPHPIAETQQLVIDKLGMRGFTLVERHATAEHAELRFLGNRDYHGVTTIGSVYYASIAPVSTVATRITLLGKPTIDHAESCPHAGIPCVPLNAPSDWGISGREEADVIRGVFAELQLEATLANETRCGAG